MMRLERLKHHTQVSFAFFWVAPLVLAVSMQIHANTDTAKQEHVNEDTLLKQSCKRVDRKLDFDSDKRIDTYQCANGKKTILMKYNTLYESGEYVYGDWWNKKGDFYIHVLDLQGNVIIPSGKYDYIDMVYQNPENRKSESYFIVSKRDPHSRSRFIFGVINQNQEAILPLKYTSIDYLKYHDRYIVRSLKPRRQYDIFDATGKKLTSEGFSSITRLSNGGSEPVRRVKQNGKYGLVELATGRLIFATVYDWLGLEYYDYGGKPKISTAKKAGKWGVINLQSETIVPFKYDYISLDTYAPAYFEKGYQAYQNEGLHFTVIENDTLKNIIYKDNKLVQEKVVPDLYSERLTRVFIKSAYPNGAYVIKDGQAKVPFMYFSGSYLHMGDIEKDYPVEQLENGFRISMTAHSRFAKKDITRVFSFIKNGESYLCDACPENRVAREWVKLK